MQYRGQWVSNILFLRDSCVQVLAAEILEFSILKVSLNSMYSKTVFQSIQAKLVNCKIIFYIREFLQYT